MSPSVEAPGWAEVWSLEAVAWCMDGVGEELGERLLELSVPDERHRTAAAAAEYHMNREPECDYSDPNMLHRQWKRLEKEDQLALIEIGEAHFGEGGA